MMKHKVAKDRQMEMIVDGDMFFLKPCMNVLADIFINSTPLEIYNYIDGDDVKKKETVINFVELMVGEVVSWVKENHSKVNEVGRYAQDFYIKKINEDSITIKNIDKISMQDEQMFMASSGETSIRKENAKVLSALSVIRIYKDIEKCSHMSGKSYIAAFEFFCLVRSLVRFALYHVTLDGMGSHRGRHDGGKRNRGDYDGYEAFILKFFPNFADGAKTHEKLWNEIRDMFTKKSHPRHCNHYKISFDKFYLATSDIPGGLKQVSPDGKVKRLGYKAFSDMLSRIKKTGSSTPNVELALPDCFARANWLPGNISAGWGFLGNQRSATWWSSPRSCILAGGFLKSQ